jgi:hypothetical protein
MIKEDLGWRVKNSPWNAPCKLTSHPGGRKALGVIGLSETLLVPDPESKDRFGLGVSWPKSVVNYDINPALVGRE